jgi:hypothetical protein
VPQNRLKSRLDQLGEAQGFFSLTIFNSPDCGRGKHFVRLKSVERLLIWSCKLGYVKER